MVVLRARRHIVWRRGFILLLLMRRRRMLLVLRRWQAVRHTISGRVAMMRMLHMMRRR